MDSHKNIHSLLILGSSGKQGLLWSKRLKEAGYFIGGIDTTESPNPNLDWFARVDILDTKKLSVLSLSYDAIFVAVPASVSEAVIENIVLPYGENRLIIDLLSEKESFAQLLAEKNAKVSHIGVHLLFAPTVDWDGQNVLVTPRDISDVRALEIVQLLEEWGCRVHYCEAPEHDQLMSVVQVSVHALIFSYSHFFVSQGLDFKLLDLISTPTSRIMWALAARMLVNSPAVYWEIQKDNSFAQNVRRQLIDSVSKLDEFVNVGDKDSFDHVFEELAKTLGNDADKYVQLAEAIFSHKAQTP